MKIAIYKGSKVGKSLKILICPKMGKRAKIGFSDFTKNSTIIFSRNGLKRSGLWLANFLRKPIIGGNPSCSAGFHALKNWPWNSDIVSPYKDHKWWPIERQFYRLLECLKLLNFPWAVPKDPLDPSDLKAPKPSSHSPTLFWSQVCNSDIVSSYKNHKWWPRVTVSRLLECLKL